MVDRKVNIILAAKNRAGRVLDRIRDKFRALGRAAASVKGVIIGALGTAALVRSVQASIDAITVQINAERKLEGVLRATGEAAGFNAEQMKLRAAALQQATTFGDEEIINLQSQLATFGVISGENFDRATEAALNMATVFDTQLRLAGRQLGQSLAEPALALTRLRRQGIIFTQEQEKLIESLAESGRTAEAQEVILDKLENSFGGVAQSIATGPVGAIKQAKNTIGDLVEGIGQAFAPFVASILQGIARIGEAITPFLVSAIRSFSQFFLEAMRFTSEAVLAFQKAGVTAVTAVNFAFENARLVIRTALDSALLSVVTFQNQLTHVFTEVIPGVLDWFLTNWRDIFTTIWDFTRTLITNLAENIVEVLSNIPELIRGEMDFSDVWTPITEGFKSSISELPEFAGREVGELEKQLRNKVEEAGGKIGEDFQKAISVRLEGVGGEGSIPQALRRAADEGLAALEAGAPFSLPKGGGEGGEGVGDGRDSGGGTGGGSGRDGRAGIEALTVSRQFRGLTERFRAGVDMARGGTTPEEKTAEQTKKTAEESKRTAESVRLLLQEFRRGNTKVVRAGLTR